MTGIPPRGANLPPDDDDAASGFSIRISVEAPNDDFHDNYEEPTRDDGKRLASIVDEREQIVGVAKLKVLITRIKKLDKELQLLRSTSYNVASSARIFSSVLRFRQRLAQLEYTAKQNARTLFPGRIRPPKYPTEILVHDLSRRPKPLRMPSMTQFPLEMEEFAKEVEMFGSRLQRFREVESTSDIDVFCQKMKYSGIYLRKMPGPSFRSPELRLHIHNLLVDIGEHFEGITSSLEELRTIGMPVIRSSQQHTAESLYGLATVATLFAGVTATTLQFSWEMQPQKASSIAVNTFWFSSLVLAITAAVGSMLWRTWRLSVYRTRRRDIPWWILIWIYHNAPLVFLVLSIASFLIGLCVFAYTSNQHVITFTITTALTAMTSIGLIVISLWLAYEQLAKYGDDSYTADPQTDLRAIHNYILHQWRFRRQGMQDSEKGDEFDDKSMPSSEEAWKMVAPKTISQEWKDDPKELRHKAVVNDLQFSPNGKYLATAGWDNSVKIWETVFATNSESLDVRSLHVLPHDDFVHEVQWVEDSDRIITRAGTHVTVWRIQGTVQKECQWTVEHVKSIIWMPRNKTVLAVTYTQIRRLPIKSADGYNLTNFPEFDMKLRGIALTSQDNYLLVVGIEGKEEKSILRVYSVNNATRHANTNLSADVRAIVLAKPRDTVNNSQDINHALVSYDNQTPPELWRIEKTTSGDSWSLKKLRTYRTWEKTDASRRCCFGGADDEFVICAGKDGGIFRWDRDSGELLDHIAPNKTFSCISWNRGNEKTDIKMIATGEHDGDIKIWTGKKDTPKPPIGRALAPAPTTQSISGSIAEYLSQFRPGNQEN